jgi:hypothetical protein
MHLLRATECVVSACVFVSVCISVMLALKHAGHTTYVTDKDTGRVVRHIEEWDTDPVEVLKRLAVPSSKNPKSRKAKLVLNASRGDMFSLFQVALMSVTALASVVLTLTVAWRLHMHQGAAPFWGSPEGSFYSLAFIVVSALSFVFVFLYD